MALPPSPAPYLSEGRYVTTLAVVHSIMVDHLEELSLVEVSAHLKEQILVHKREKEKMAVENNAIYLTVTHFIADCNRLVPGSSEFVKRFHDFMTWMLIALGLEKKYWNAFVVRIKQVTDFNQFKSIQNVSSLMQGVKYDGEGQDVKDDESMEAERRRREE